MNVIKTLPLFLLILSISTFSYGDNYPKNPNIDILDYSFKIELSDNSEAIKCVADVDVRYLKEGEEWLRLDLVNVSPNLDNKGMRVSAVFSDGKAVEYTHESDRLNIKLPNSSKLNQRQKYTITYAGVPATGMNIGENKYGDRTFFSNNWPNKARNWLPVVDHPYDKATCEFIVTAPAHYQVVSNGLLLESSDLANGKHLTHWKQSVPIASWLYVLGVARFAVQYVDEFEHKSIESWVYYQDRDAGFEEYAEPTKEVLAYYSDYIGPFSYEKLANIQSNSVGGGMEAASAILYSEKSVVGHKNERWRNVIIHEIAHQWFGNSVTEYDWDDVWLSEGFATYFTLLFIEHQYGHDAFMQRLASSKKTVDNFDIKNPDYRIVHDDLSDMSKVTSSHTYQKGSWTLHMLRGMLGDEIFWKGIRSYYQKYQNKNAVTADFRREMEEASGLDLAPFFEQWLYKSGRLICEWSWKYDQKRKEITIDLKQVQNSGNIFKMPVQVGIYAKEADPVIKTIQLDQASQTFKIPGDTAPENVVLDPDSWVLMDAKLVKK